jgi:nitroimidazol reductase NimA-like FMN-containing flavoprotein (pyridoxamine 5'-phosphate oxidase superfamily)
MTETESGAFLANASLGRLGWSLNNQPYVVPIYFVYEPDYIYALSTFGQKTEWKLTGKRKGAEPSHSRWTREWSIVNRQRFRGLLIFRRWLHSSKENRP